MKTIYDGDGIEFKARFFSGNVKALVIPGKAEWRLECDTTGTLLQDWTEATLVTDVVEGVINEAYGNASTPTNSHPQNPAPKTGGNGSGNRAMVRAGSYNPDGLESGCK